MSKFLVCILLVFISIPANAGNELVQNFAGQILRAVKSNDRESLKNLSCYPEQDQCVTDEGLKYVLGDGSETGEIRKVLISKNIKTRVIGPFTFEEPLPNATYGIVYYNPEVVKFSKQGFMDVKVREEQWNKGYVETLVTVIKGKVYLHRTIFYHGTHLPWEGEYEEPPPEDSPDETQ